MCTKTKPTPGGRPSSWPCAGLDLTLNFLTGRYTCTVWLFFCLFLRDIRKSSTGTRILITENAFEWVSSLDVNWLYRIRGVYRVWTQTHTHILCGRPIHTEWLTHIRTSTKINLSIKNTVFDGRSYTIITITAEGESSSSADRRCVCHTSSRSIDIGVNWRYSSHDNSNEPSAARVHSCE